MKFETFVTKMFKYDYAALATIKINEATSKPH